MLIIKFCGIYIIELGQVMFSLENFRQLTPSYNLNSLVKSFHKFSNISHIFYFLF